MPPRFLLYGATGYVGGYAARLAVEQGLEPMLAGRDAAAVEAMAASLELPWRTARLDDPEALDRALDGVPAVLHCAGPFLHTWKPMLAACLRTHTHYLDITGEIPVLAAMADRDGEARAAGIMLLPAVGFDVVATDCLALHLKERLPSATHLVLAFRKRGPAGIPPGTLRTTIAMLPYGLWVRRDGELRRVRRVVRTRRVDFGPAGGGPATVTRLTWGDVVTAHFSTGIPNTEVYIGIPPGLRRALQLTGLARPLLRLAAVGGLLARVLPAGATEAERAATTTHVWGEVTDPHGGRAAARLHGPEAGAVWTARAALAVVQRVLAGDVTPGYQTPAQAYGPDLVLDCQGVTREDLPA